MADTLIHAYQRFGGLEQSEVPWPIWLLENPDSPLALAGAIPLKEHDYLHILLNRGKSPDDEAFIIGFTMGNDVNLNTFHTWLLKLASCFLYPKEYRFTRKHWSHFDAGIQAGKQLQTKNLCRFDFSSFEKMNLEQLRTVLQIDLLC